MKYRTKLKIVLALLVAFLGGISVSTLITKKESPKEPVDSAVYESDFSRACRLLSANTMAVSDLANEVCSSWIRSVALGYNSTDQIEKVFFELEKTGTKPRVVQAHQDLECLIAKLKDYPFKYREAYHVLEQTYALYCQLYKLALSPSGSLVMFNKNVREREAELAQAFSRLNLYTPKETAQSPDRPRLVTPAPTAGDAAVPAPRVNEQGSVQRSIVNLLGKNADEVASLFGEPVAEVRSAPSGGLSRQYSHKGRTVTVFYRGDIVSGWTE